MAVLVCALEAFGGLLLENASMLNMCGVRGTQCWQRPCGIRAH